MGTDCFVNLPINNKKRDYLTYISVSAADCQLFSVKLISSIIGGRRKISVNFLV